MTKFCCTDTPEGKLAPVPGLAADVHAYLHKLALILKNADTQEKGFLLDWVTSAAQQWRAETLEPKLVTSVGVTLGEL